MISVGRKIAFIGIIFLAIVGFAFVQTAHAQVHGCTLAGANDRTDEAEITLGWSFTHDQCIIVSPGTTVTWNGSFNTHPLAGGDVTIGKDNASPISSPGDNIGSVTFNDEGDFPYFCLVHLGNMTGVIYVRASSPGEFNKSNPANGAINQSTSPNFTWAASSGANSYEYCIDQSLNGSCNEVWTSVGANTNANLAGLSSDTLYQWQVRAMNDGGTTEANGGSWWNFRTIVDPPGAFSKSSPANGATDQSTVTTLTWSASSGARSYEYCIDISNNNNCNDSWINVGASTSGTPDELSGITTYYWQVRAVNGGGSTEANSETWWNFTSSDFAEGIFGDGFEDLAP